MEFFQLQDDLIIQIISRKQYDKLTELQDSQPNTGLQVPLKNGKHGLVHMFFKYRDLLYYKKTLEGLAITKLYKVKSEGSTMITIGYWNYISNKFECSSNHPDNIINGVSWIRSAISFLMPSDYYLIAQIIDQ